jgi:hypothetical protein
VTAERISPFRQRIESAAKRLEGLAKRSSSMQEAAVRREIVALREASALLEGEPCNVCDGRGEVMRETEWQTKIDRCPNCGGTGDL